MIRTSVCLSEPRLFSILPFTSRWSYRSEGSNVVHKVPFCCTEGVGNLLRMVGCLLQPGYWFPPPPRAVPQPSLLVLRAAFCTSLTLQPLLTVGINCCRLPLPLVMMSSPEFSSKGKHKLQWHSEKTSPWHKAGEAPCWMLCREGVSGMRQTNVQEREREPCSDPCCHRLQIVDPCLKGLYTQSLICFLVSIGFWEAK